MLALPDGGFMVKFVLNFTFTVYAQADNAKTFFLTASRGRLLWL